MRGAVRGDLQQSGHVAGQDDGLKLLVLSLQRERAEQIVGLEPLQRVDRDAHAVEQLEDAFSR